MPSLIQVFWVDFDALPLYPHFPARWYHLFSESGFSILLRRSIIPARGNANSKMKTEENFIIVKPTKTKYCAVVRPLEVLRAPPLELSCQGGG